MLLCIYCQENSFDPGRGSEEHAVLSSLGGRKASRNICCEDCNNRLGDEIDKPFSEEYAFFSTMLGITTGRNKEAPTHRAAIEHEGLAYDLKSGGSFKLSKALVSIEDQTDDASCVSITAGSEEQALALIEQVLKKFGKTIDDFQSLEAKSVKSYLPTEHKRMALGGTIQFRAVAKMLLTYLATLVSPERLRSEAFCAVISFINGCNNEFSGANIGSRIMLPDDPKISDINHRAFIFASSKNQLVVGVLELFGNIKYTIELASAWDGPDISKVYVIDPIDHSRIEENVNFDPLSGFNDYDNYKPNIDSVVAGVDNVIRSFQEMQSNRQISSLTTAAIERHMVGKGDIVTKEMIANVANEVALEFMKFIHRINTKHTIDLKKKI